MVANLERFVADGGTLVVGFFSGIVDPADHIRPGAYPTALRDLLGLRVEEIVPFQATETNRVRTADGESSACDTWAELDPPRGVGGGRHLRSMTSTGRTGR